MAVTVQGITLSQIHPVLDGRNRPLLAPTSYDLNTSIQRCLVKAIALHGLGLCIYAGEDLPAVGTDATPANDMPTRPTESQPPNSNVRSIAPTISVLKQNHIHKLITETGTNLNRFLEHFGVAAIKDITDSEFMRIVHSLESRRAA